MDDVAPLDAQAIRARRADATKTRDRDLAESLGISEAQLVAAHVGQPNSPMRAVRIAAHPDRVMPAAESLGEVMALTRNLSCVHEKVGQYANYHSGDHASMVLNGAIDLRIFPSKWVHGYLVEIDGDQGTRRSVQVFDAAGDAVHKIHLREGSDQAAFDALKSSLALEDQSDIQTVEPRAAPEEPKSNPEKLDLLRKEWQRLTDTHQFLRLVSKLRMNRLGAYRIAGAPFVRAVEPGAFDTALEAFRDQGLNIMVFTGNRGCIQIHSGPIHKLMEMGPWQNVMDPGFNLHLRRDHIAELWAVEKPTQRGPAVSLEAFDADGQLITQIFAVSKEGQDSRPAFGEIITSLKGLDAE